MMNGETNGTTPSLSNGDAMKRKRDSVDNLDHNIKRGKTDSEASPKQDNVLLVDDSGEGTILID